MRGENILDGIPDIIIDLPEDTILLEMGVVEGAYVRAITLVGEATIEPDEFGQVSIVISREAVEEMQRILGEA